MRSMGRQGSHGKLKSRTSDRTRRSTGPSSINRRRGESRAVEDRDMRSRDLQEQSNVDLQRELVEMRQFIRELKKSHAGERSEMEWKMKYLQVEKENQEQLAVIASLKDIVRKQVSKTPRIRGPEQTESSDDAPGKGEMKIGERARWEARLEAETAKCRECVKDRREAQRVAEDLKAENTKLSEKMQTAQARINQLDQQVQEGRNRVDAILQSGNQQIEKNESLEKQIARLKSKLKKNKEEYELERKQQAKVQSAESKARQEEKAAIEEAYQKLQKENGSQRMRLKEMQSLGKAAKSTANQLSEQLQAKDRQLAQMKQEIIRLKREISGASKERDSAINRIRQEVEARFTTEMANHAQAQEQIHRDLVHQRATNGLLEQEISQLHAQIELNQALKDAKLRAENAEAEIKSLTSKYSSLEGALKNVEHERTEAQTTISELNSKVEELTEQNQLQRLQLQSELEERGKALFRIQSKLKLQNKQLEEQLQSQRDGSQQKIQEEAWAKEREDMLQAKERMRMKLATALQVAAKAQAKNKTLSKELEKILASTDSVAQETTNSNLEVWEEHKKRLAAAHQENEQLRIELKELQQVNKEAGKQLKRMTVNVQAKIRNNKDAASVEFQRISDTCSQLVTRNDSLERRVEELKEQNSKLSEQVSRSKEKLKTDKKTITRLTAKCKQSDDTIAETKNQARLLEQQLRAKSIRLNKKEELFSNEAKQYQIQVEELKRKAEAAKDDFKRKLSRERNRATALAVRKAEKTLKSKFKADLVMEAQRIGQCICGGAAPGSTAMKKHQLARKNSRTSIESIENSNSDDANSLTSCYYATDTFVGNNSCEELDLVNEKDQKDHLSLILMGNDDMQSAGSSNVIDVDVQTRQLGKPFTTRRKNTKAFSIKQVRRSASAMILAGMPGKHSQSENNIDAIEDYDENELNHDDDTCSSTFVTGGSDIGPSPISKSEDKMLKKKMRTRKGSINGQRRRSRSRGSRRGSRSSNMVSADHEFDAATLARLAHAEEENKQLQVKLRSMQSMMNAMEAEHQRELNDITNINRLRHSQKSGIRQHSQEEESSAPITAQIHRVTSTFGHSLLPVATAHVAKPRSSSLL